MPAPNFKPEPFVEKIVQGVAEELRRHPPVPVRWLRPAEAARYVGATPRMLEQRRSLGQPPHFHKMGRLVVYAIEDLDSWLESGRQ